MSVAGTAGHAGKPLAGAAAHETDGTAGPLPKASHLPTPAGTPGLSLPAEGPDYHPAKREPASEQARVWSADVTYLPEARGFLYLVTILSWHSRYELAWRLSNTLEEAGTILQVLQRAAAAACAGLPDAGGGLPRGDCRRGSVTEDKEVLGPTGLGIMRGSAGIPLDCGLILSSQWGPPHPSPATSHS